MKIGQHLIAAVVQDAVDAEIELGGVHLEDVALEQVQEPGLGGEGAAWCCHAGWIVRGGLSRQAGQVRLRRSGEFLVEGGQRCLELGCQPQVGGVVT